MPLPAGVSFVMRMVPAMVVLACSVTCVDLGPDVSDESIMLDFRDSIVNLQQWRTANNKQGWDSTPICGWSGVTCSDDGSSVVKIDIPCDANCSLPAQAPFPTNLAHLTSLQLLNLNNNRMPGELPVSWSDETLFGNLSVLSLANLGLYGPLPPDWGKAGSFVSVRLLSLANNNITGTLPTEWGSASADSWPQLQAMLLFNNSLQGFVPSSWMSFGNQLTYTYLKPGNPQLCGNSPVSNSLIICSVDQSNTAKTFNPLTDCQPVGFLGQTCASNTPDQQRLHPGDKVLPLFLDLLLNSSVRFDFQQREHDNLIKALSMAMPGAAADGVLVLSPVVNATDPFALTNVGGRMQGRRLLQTAPQSPLYQQLVAATVTARPNVTAQQLQQQLESAVRSGELRQLLQQEPGWEGLMAVDLATQQTFLVPDGNATAGSSPANAPAAPPASSDNTVAIAIGVAVPCAVVAALVIIGAALYVRRMRRGGGAPAPLTAEGPKDVTLESGGSGPSSQATSGTIPSASDPTHPPLRHGSSAIMRLESLRKGSGINASLLQNMVASAHVSDWEIDPKRLTLCERPDGSVWELGRGAYSRVYKAMYDDVHTVALKVLQQTGDTPSAAMFDKELAILRKCHNKNIVQFFGACLTDSQSVLAFEYMEHGDLFKWLSSGATRFDFVSSTGKPMLAHKVALDIARGLHFLHSRSIVHNDLKSANILLSKDGTAKIADVGLARVLRHGYVCSSSGGVVGTFAWAAPEVLLGRPVSPKADVYSYGVVLWELATNERPERGMLRPPRIPQECPEEVGRLIDACLSEEPRSRPTMVEVIEVLSGMQRRYEAALLKEVGKASGTTTESSAGEEEGRSSHGGSDTGA